MALFKNLYRIEIKPSVGSSTNYIAFADSYKSAVSMCCKWLEGITPESCVLYLVHPKEALQLEINLMGTRVTALYHQATVFDDVLYDLDTESIVKYSKPGEHSKGLYPKYKVAKVDGSTIDPKAKYFILRYDTDQEDKNHMEASRYALLHYSRKIRKTNPSLADDLLTAIDW